MGTALTANYETELQIFELEQRKAKAMITGNILPQQFKNVGDVIILNEMSRVLSVPTVMLAQQLYIVHGKPSMSGQLVIAMLNGSGRFDKNMMWETREKPWGVRAYNYLDGERVEGEWIDDELIKANKWESNPHWKNNKGLMARYRAASWFGRLYAPDVLLGFSVEGEVIEGEVLPESSAPNSGDIPDLNALASSATTVTPEPIREQPKRKKRTQARMKLEAEAERHGIKVAGHEENEELRVSIAKAKAARSAGTEQEYMNQRELADLGEEPETPHDHETGEVIDDLGAALGEVPESGKQLQQSTEPTAKPRAATSNEVSIVVAHQISYFLSLGLPRGHFNGFVTELKLSVENIQQFLDKGPDYIKEQIESFEAFFGGES